MIRDKIVITGLGTVAPNGNNTDQFWESLISSKSGIGPISYFDTSNHRVSIAGQLSNFTPDKFINPKERIDIVKDIGTIFSEYRDQLYNYGFSDSGTIEKKEIIDFLNLSIQYFDHTTSLNIDNNQLYNSYNILKFSQNNTHLDVNYLYEMLEGQVAVLSSGYLSTKDSIKLLKNLYSSEIYRQDQNSFMLYPIKKINSFMSKNIINENWFIHFIHFYSPFRL